MKEKELKVKSKENKKKKPLGKHKKKLIRVLVYIVLVLFMLSLLFGIGYGIYYLSTSSKFNITKIEVLNNSIYDVDTLVQTSGVKLGENLYKVSKKQVKENLDVLPYIQEVTLNKKDSSILQIVVTEYTSKYFAYNEDTDKYVRLTENGVILDQVDGELKQEEELLVFGISFDDNFELKSVIAKTELAKLEMYKKVNSVYAGANIGKEITNVEFKNQNIILTLNYDVNVILNTQDLDYDINFLRSILSKIEGKAGTIDMTKENPVFTESIR